MQESLSAALAASTIQWAKQNWRNAVYACVAAGGIALTVHLAQQDAPAPTTPASPVSAPVATNAPTPGPVALELEVRPGDTLISMLTDSKVQYDEAYNVVSALKSIYNPRQLSVGQNISLNLDMGTQAATAASVKALSIEVSPLKTIKLTRGPNGEYKVKQVDAALTKNLVRGGGVITSSLYETGVNSGVPAALISELIKALSYDVDFQRDIKDGDRLDVLFERYDTDSGHTGKHGKLVYAALKTRKKNLEIFSYTDKTGNTEYYSRNGESVRKALLRTPINGAKITSGFGMRHHPILGYSKMHKGVDFGAAIGTPVYAAGDGVVSFSSRKGGYGNYLVIKHNGTYATAYGHLSRFGSGIHPGVKVKQGQVVAYVGTTGMSTGPHLHYEILQNGAQVNPAGVKFKTGNKLTGKEFAAFKTSISSVETTLASLKNGEKRVVAQAQDAKNTARN